MLSLTSWQGLLLYVGMFLPVAYLVYFVLPKRWRWTVLLVASYTFFWQTSKRLMVYLFAATLATWAGGLLLERTKNSLPKPTDHKETRDERKARRARLQRRMRWVCAVAVLVVLGMLVVLKYGNFLQRIFTKLVPVGHKTPVASVLLPLGISFYTLSALGYLIDVYRGKYPACKNLGTIALFLSFFPALTEGPISRFDELAPQLRAGEIARRERLVYATQLIVWGMVKKIVISDRIAPLVNMIFDNHSKYQGVMVLIAAALYTLQLYADFSGVIDIARGSAELFGITLAQNFRQPFFSKSVNEFWRRWHMTLGSWLRDYVFYPVSLSSATRTMSGWARTHLTGNLARIVPTLLALLAVWAATGIWHGAAWKYVAYGLYYFGIVLIGMLLEPALAAFFERTGIKRDGLLNQSVAMLRTVVLVIFGMMLFRANGLHAFLQMFRSIFAGPGTEALADNYWLSFQVSFDDLIVTLIGGAVMLAVDLAHEHDVALRPLLLEHGTALRWACGIALVAILLTFGAYGVNYIPIPSIYANF